MKFTAQYIELLKKVITASVPIQSVWATVQSIDWNEKTMVAIGKTDNIEYFDVLLGLGSVFYHPVKDSKVLIGIIANKDANAFLISCESFEELLIVDSEGFEFKLKAGLLTMNGDGFEGIVKAPELKTQVDKNTEVLKSIQQVFNSWTPSPMDGGAALKSLVTQFTTKPVADLSNIQNEKILHG